MQPFDRRFHLIALVTLLTALTGVGASGAGEYLAYAVTEKGELPLPRELDGIEDSELIRIKWGEYTGPQLRLGVLAVDNDSGASSYKVSGPDGTVVAYSVSDIQREVPVNGIEAMLTDVLHQSGRFRMVERAVLGEVLAEQDLAASGRVAKPSGAATGQVLGAEYLVQAVVTSYEPNFKGRKVGLGGITRGLLGGAKVGKQKSMIGMSFRLIDAETSEMLFTRQVDVVVGKSSFDLGGIGWGGSGALGATFSTFSKTPIGQAVLAAINIGAYELVKQIGNEAPQGSVIKVDGDKVYVNLGEGAVESGSRLTALSKGEELIDPETGLSLGGLDQELGTLEVLQVQDKFCIARPSGFDPSTLQRGDVVRSNEEAAPMRFASSWDGKTSKD